jgi:hypothetical protein
VPSALGTAVDRIAWASDPEPGSVRQKAAIDSPVAHFGRKRLLLLLAAEEDDALAADGLVGAEIDGERGVDRADLAENAVVDFSRRTESTILLRYAESHESELVHPVPHVVREACVVIEFRRVDG